MIPAIECVQVHGIAYFVKKKKVMGKISSESICHFFCRRLQLPLSVGRNLRHNLSPCVQPIPVFLTAKEILDLMDLETQLVPLLLEVSGMGIAIALVAQLKQMVVAQCWDGPQTA